MTVSEWDSDTVPLNTCPQGFTLGTSLSKKGRLGPPTPRELLCFSSLGFLCLGHSAPRSRAEDTSSFRRGLCQPCAAHCPGTPGRHTGHPRSIEAQAALTPGWGAGRKHTAPSSPAASGGPLGTAAPGAGGGPVSSCGVGWSHRAGALLAACIHTLTCVVQRPSHFRAVVILIFTTPGKNEFS